MNYIKIYYPTKTFFEMAPSMPDQHTYASVNVMLVALLHQLRYILNNVIQTHVYIQEKFDEGSKKATDRAYIQSIFNEMMAGSAANGLCVEDIQSKVVAKYMDNMVMIFTGLTAYTETESNNIQKTRSNALIAVSDAIQVSEMLQKATTDSDVELDHENREHISEIHNFLDKIDVEAKNIISLKIRINVELEKIQKLRDQEQPNAVIVG